MTPVQGLRVRDWGLGISSIARARVRRVAPSAIVEAYQYDHDYSVNRSHPKNNKIRRLEIDWSVEKVHVHDSRPSATTKAAAAKIIQRAKPANMVRAENCSPRMT